MRAEVFMDSEFTGLHKNSTLISIGLTTLDNKEFYAELTDYDPNQVDDWIQENVIERLFLTHEGLQKHGDTVTFKGTKDELRKHLTEWLKEIGQVEMWSDCLAYDWVLFNDIFGHALDIPKNILYIPFDICTVFRLKGVDPDIPREEYAGTITDVADKHNALHDAIIIKDCYKKLMNL